MTPMRSKRRRVCRKASICFCPHKRKDTIPKKEVPRPQPDDSKRTGYMNIDVKGKVKELKALTRKERLDLARFKNKQKARRK